MCNSSSSCARRFYGASVISALKMAEAEGRLTRYILDLGWQEPLAAYIVYGKSGGTKEAKAFTEALLEAIIFK